jgi:hypothetical protein
MTDGYLLRVLYASAFRGAGRTGRGAMTFSLLALAYDRQLEIG